MIVCSDGVGRRLASGISAKLTIAVTLTSAYPHTGLPPPHLQSRAKASNNTPDLIDTQNASEKNKNASSSSKVKEDKVISSLAVRIFD